MKIWSDNFKNKGRIPAEFAFGQYDPKQHCVLSTNRNPHLAWDGLPDRTKSLVMICDDPDVPSKPDDVNQAGRTIPANLPRIQFFHWVLVDLDPQPAQIKSGEFSDGIVVKGKPGPDGPRGTRQGINDYTKWFEGDPQMGGLYYGYDGPCPPWNDELIHHYQFTLYALDLDRVPLQGRFDGPAIFKAIQGHTLDQARLTGLYAINPEVSALPK